MLINVNAIVLSGLATSKAIDHQAKKPQTMIIVIEVIVIEVEQRNNILNGSLLWLLKTTRE
jgi:hypothetical protein